LVLFRRTSSGYFVMIVEDRIMKITASSYRQMPEALWRRLSKLLPKPKPHPRGGRPPLDPRKVANGIYFVMRTGCPWKAAPQEFGSGSSLHLYFQTWCQRGVFRKLWKQGLAAYDQRKRIGWRWQTLDATLTKAPLGGEKNREKPDRSRQVGCQAFGADRLARRGAGAGHRGSESPRPDLGCADARQSTLSPTATSASTTATLVCRQSLRCPRVSLPVETASLPSPHQVAWRRDSRKTSPPLRQSSTLGQ
jgi:transposase